MYEQQKQQLIETAKEMLKYGLITLSGGNVSLRVSSKHILVTPSAILYDNMTIDDIVVVDHSGKIIEGNKRPTSDLPAILYIFNNRPDLNAIIHTHQPYATAVGVIADALPPFITEIIDVAHGEIPVAPFTASSDKGMGVMALNYCNQSPAVILRSHGLIAFSDTLYSALEIAVYIEEASKTYLAARAAGQIKLLTREEIASENEDCDTYGQ